MIHKRLNLLFIISFLFLNYINGTFQQCNINVPYYKDEFLVLDTVNGKIRGSCDLIEINDPNFPNMTDYIIAWKSIPFAEPPINENRFKKPVQKKNWPDIKDGTKWPNACMQSGVLFVPGIFISEDCLYLNVFVSAKSYMKHKNNTGPQKPILLYIHGGNFVSGSSVYYDPSINIALSDIIYVTIQYRVGPFGFMHLAGSDISGNQGFLDQHLALKWTYENADRFGGDKNRITVSGQSAGSWSTSYHLIYTPSWPYMNSVILQSGSILFSSTELFTSSELTKRTKIVLKNSGCDFDLLNSTYFNSCLQNVNESRIISETINYYNSTILSGNNNAQMLNPMFQLVLDGIEFKETVKESIRNRRFKNLNTLSGFTSEEMSFFLLPIFGTDREPILSLKNLKELLDATYTYFLRYPEKPSFNITNQVINEYISNSSIKNYFSTLVQILTEQVFISPAIHFAELYSEKNPAYVFSFEQYNPLNRFPKYYGVVHSDEIPFVFGNPMLKRYNGIFSSDDIKLSKQIIMYWTNFVKFGNPNGNITSFQNNYTYWPSMSNAFQGVNSNDQNYLILNGTSIKIGTQFTYQGMKRHLEFWRPYENISNTIRHEKNLIFIMVLINLIIKYLK